MADRVNEELDEAESLRLISAGGIGRIAYLSRFGPAVLPVNYRWHDGAVVFRTARHSALDEDLQTGISGGDYEVAFEIDDIDVVERQGWSVLIQGPAHHGDSAGGARRPRRRASSPGRPGNGNCSCGSSRTTSPDAASSPSRVPQVCAGCISMAPQRHSAAQSRSRSSCRRTCSGA